MGAWSKVLIGLRWTGELRDRAPGMGVARGRRLGWSVLQVLLGRWDRWAAVLWEGFADGGVAVGEVGGPSPSGIDSES